MMPKFDVFAQIWRKIALKGYTPFRRIPFRRIQFCQIPFRRIHFRRKSVSFTYFSKKDMPMTSTLRRL